MRILFAIALLFASLFATAQESASFDFSGASGYVQNGETVDILGTDFPVYQNPTSGKRAVNPRGNYWVYWVAEATEQTTDGKTIYLTAKGKPFIWVQGSNGPYAKYGSRKAGS